MRKLRVLDIADEHADDAAITGVRDEAKAGEPVETASPTPRDADRQSVLATTNVLRGITQPLRLILLCSDTPQLKLGPVRQSIPFDKRGYSTPHVACGPDSMPLSLK